MIHLLSFSLIIMEESLDESWQGVIFRELSIEDIKIIGNIGICGYRRFFCIFGE